VQENRIETIVKDPAGARLDRNKSILIGGGLAADRRSRHTVIERAVSVR